MTEHPDQRTVEITDAGHTVATAGVVTSADPDGIADVGFHAVAGHLPVGVRGDLVDAVLDLPEVSGSSRLQATVPIGDTESLNRLRERTTDMTTYAAGSTALVTADLPQPAPHADPEAGS